MSSTAAFHHADRETVDHWLQARLAELAARGITNGNATITSQVQPCLIIRAQRNGEPPFEDVALIEAEESWPQALQRWATRSRAFCRERPTPGFAAFVRVSEF